MKLIKKPIFLIVIVTMLVTTMLSGLTIAENEMTDGKDNEHTVLVELKAATNCPYCPYQENAIPNLDGEYEYVTLAFQTYYGVGWNDASENRESELDQGDGFPTSYYDGGYDKVVGGGSGIQTPMQNALDSAAGRTVADVDLNLNVIWKGNAEIDIGFEVTNTGSSTYDGHLRIYIVEIESRYNNYYGQPMENALLSLPSDEDFSVNPSSTWTTSFTWDGNTHGYGDITSDNILVIAAVFDQSTDYVDDTISSTPAPNVEPTASFSYNPIGAEEGEMITFTDDSIDSDGSIVGWNWDFGDGNTSTLQNPTHYYQESGYYTISLTVEDNVGATDDYSSMIVITEPGETLIASQSQFSRGFPIRHAIDGDWAGAQSFNATATTLTKTDLYLRKFGTPEFNLTVELREDDPEGTLLTTMIFTPDQIPSTWEWFEIDFNDTTVVPGNDYFLVCPPAPSGVTTSFGYEWGYAFGNQYDDGSFWFTRDGGGLWRDLPTMYEFTFTVYGA